MEGVRREGRRVLVDVVELVDVLVHHRVVHPAVRPVDEKVLSMPSVSAIRSWAMSIVSDFLFRLLLFGACVKRSVFHFRGNAKKEGTL